MEVWALCMLLHLLCIPIKMKYYLLILITGTLLLGCGSDNSGEFSLKGNLENGAGMTLYLDELGTTSIFPFDSVIVEDDGSFEFSAVITEVGFYKIRLGTNNFVNIILHPEDKIEMTAEASYLYGTYKVTGSQDADALYELNEYLRLFGVKTDSLRQAGVNIRGGQNPQLAQFQLQNFYNGMIADKSQFLRDFVDANPSSVACLAAVESLDPAADEAYFLKVDKELHALYPNSPFVKNETIP